MNPIRLALVAMLALGPAAIAAGKLTDSDILNKIHAINQEEIAAAQLAQKTSQDGKVLQFAGEMITDHTAADGQVSALAQKKGIALTDNSNKPNPLATMNGVDFDRAYAKAMASGHGDALKFLAKADAEAKDADVKALVEKLQPTVSHHEKMAEGLGKKLQASNTP